MMSLHTQVLSDEDKRRAYDSYGQTDFSGQGAAGTYSVLLTCAKKCLVEVTRAHYMYMYLKCYVWQME